MGTCTLASTYAQVHMHARPPARMHTCMGMHTPAPRMYACTRMHTHTRVLTRIHIRTCMNTRAQACAYTQYCLHACLNLNVYGLCGMIQTVVITSISKSIVFKKSYDLIHFFVMSLIRKYHLFYY